MWSMLIFLFTRLVLTSFWMTFVSSFQTLHRRALGLSTYIRDDPKLLGDSGEVPISMFSESNEQGRTNRCVILSDLMWVGKLVWSTFSFLVYLLRVDIILDDIRTVIPNTSSPCVRALHVCWVSSETWLEMTPNYRVIVERHPFPCSQRAMNGGVPTATLFGLISVGGKSMWSTLNFLFTCFVLTSFWMTFILSFQTLHQRALGFFTYVGFHHRYGLR